MRGDAPARWRLMCETARTFAELAAITGFCAMLLTVLA